MTLAETYAKDGYAIVRGLFSSREIADMGAAIDGVYAEGLVHGRSFRHGNLMYRVTEGQDGQPKVRMVQWPSYHNMTLNAVRLDPRFCEILAPLIGDNLKQIINQIHWKPPGEAGDFAYHQDSRFRRPASAYRDLDATYVQTGLAIDPHGAASGGMRVLPGSHLRGDLQMGIDGAVMASAAADAALLAVGLDPAQIVDIELAPGDLAIWHPYLVHGSGQNMQDHMRRFYINGYVAADACDRGEWAFRDGKPVPLGKTPRLVHYDDLHTRPEPHFV